MLKSANCDEIVLADCYSVPDGQKGMVGFARFPFTKEASLAAPSRKSFSFTIE
jgi:hypothetical protein